MTFSVLFDANIATTTPKTIVITSINVVGTSIAVSKTLTLVNAMPAIVTPITNPTSFTRCANVTLSVNPVLGASTYNWTLANGAVLVSQSANSAVIDFSLVDSAVVSSIVKVNASNFCGVASSIKSITLSSAVCPSAKTTGDVKTALSEYTVNAYPNPFTSSFGLDMSGSSENVSVKMYDMTGMLLENKEVTTDKVNELSLGQNLSSGIYILNVTQGSNVKTVRVIKN